MVKNHISPQGNVIFGGNFERVVCQAGLWLLSYGGGGTFGGTADAPQLLSRVEVLFFFLHVCVCSNAHTIIFYASVTVREFWIFPPDSVVNTHRHTHRICHMCADVSSFPLTVAISVLPYHSLSFLLFFFFSPVFLYLCFFLFFSQQHFLFSPLSLWIVPMSFINSSPTEGREGGSPMLRYTVEWAACYTTRSVSVRQLHKDGKCYGHRRGALVTFMFCIFTAIRE